MHYLDMFSQPEVTLLADVIEVGLLVCTCVCAFACVFAYCVSIWVYVYDHSVYTCSSLYLFVASLSTEQTLPS